MESVNAVVSVIETVGLTVESLPKSLYEELCHLREIKTLEIFGYVKVVAAPNEVSYLLVTEDGVSKFIKATEYKETTKIVSRYVPTMAIDGAVLGSDIAKKVRKNILKSFKSVFKD